MRSKIVLLVVMIAALFGCASTDPIWFIATPGYVESRIMVSEAALQEDYGARIAEKDTEILALKDELAAQRDTARELAALVDTINDLDRSNRELQDIAAAAQSRLDRLPTETLELIIEVLAGYLETASEPGPE